MPEIMVFLTEDEMRLIDTAYQQLGHEYQSLSQFTDAAIKQVFLDVENSLNGQQGRLKS